MNATTAIVMMIIAIIPGSLSGKLLPVPEYVVIIGVLDNKIYPKVYMWG